MSSRQDSTPLINAKISQWSGVDPADIAEIMGDKEDLLKRIMFIGNATPRMQVPVHPHGVWRGGNVGFDPANDRVFSQTLINKFDSWASGGAPVSRQIYTVTTGKTLYVYGGWLDTDAAGGLTITDATADGGTNVTVIGCSAARDEHNLTCGAAPLKFSNGIRVDGGNQTANVTFYITILGYEEET